MFRFPNTGHSTRSIVVASGALVVAVLFCVTLAAQPRSRPRLRDSDYQSLRQRFIRLYSGEDPAPTLLSADETQQLRSVRSQSPRSSTLKLGTAFVLAAEGPAGNEYQANLAVLEEPVIIWQRSPKTYTQIYRETQVGLNAGRADAPSLLSETGGPGEEPEPLEVVPTLLKELYLRRKDESLIRRLFEWRFDGGPAEILAAERLELLEKRPAEVLQVVYASQILTDGVASALVYADDEEYQRVRAGIQAALPSLDAEVARSTRALLQRVRAQR